MIEQWRKHYNGIRPHVSLGYQPPARCAASCRHLTPSAMSRFHPSQHGPVIPLTCINCLRSSPPIPPCFARLVQRRDNFAARHTPTAHLEHPATPADVRGSYRIDRRKDCTHPSKHQRPRIHIP